MQTRAPVQSLAQHRGESGQIIPQIMPQVKSWKLTCLCYNQPGIMSPKHEIQLPVFEGPLDLLLHLIEKEELDITRIALAQVTDQYLAYVRDLEQQRTRELADFLVIAAKLLLIKSIALLPRAPEPRSEVEDVGNDLVEQLRIYKRFKQIAGVLNERQNEGLQSYIRIAPVPRPAPQLDLGNVTLDDLLATAIDVLFDKKGPSADEVVKPTATIEDQVARIDNELSRHHQLRFRDILQDAYDRIEIIVTLLAVLEMIKMGRIAVHQEELFGEIIIERQIHEEPALFEVAAASEVA